MCFVHLYRFGKQHINLGEKWHKRRFSTQEVKMLGLLPHRTCGQTSPHVRPTTAQAKIVGAQVTHLRMRGQKWGVYRCAEF
ncbi:hypothetical protein CsSME_00052902 [Camellia sinensis var. sinensis]